MNILILTHSYPDSQCKWRGVFIREQARALSSEHDIIIVYFKADYSQFAPFSEYSFIKTQDGRITLYEVTINRSFPVITQLKLISDTYRFINNKILKQSKIDIIHSHLSYPGGFLGTIIQKRKKIPVILTEHSWIRTYFRSWIHKRCVLFTLKNSTCIITVSEALKEDISNVFNRKILVLPNVVDVERFSLKKTHHHKTLNIGILGGMGNLRKGLDILLKAVSLIKNTDLFIHIGGDGKLLNNFKKIAEELGVDNKCKFYGEISSADITEFYSALDIFVLASRDETFGVVIVEAMSCGIPVIATDCGGPKEIITKDTGLLIENENPEELARAIITLSENIRSYDSSTIREYALKKYGHQSFLRRISQVYQTSLLM